MFWCPFFFILFLLLPCVWTGAITFITKAVKYLDVCMNYKCSMLRGKHTAYVGWLQPVIFST